MDQPTDGSVALDGVEVQTVEQRLAIFNAKVVGHPRLIQADEALMNAICHPGDATLVLVFGPTGVGKSTMRKHIEERLVGLLMPDLLKDPERIPFASVEAVSPERGYFNWKLYYRQALMATQEVGEAMEDRKRRMGQEHTVPNITPIPVRRQLFFRTYL